MQKKEETAAVPQRLNKYLSDAGVCSRRQADRYVEEGRILVDGEKAQLGQKVMPGQKILLDGNPITISRKRILLAVNKPKGIVCTTQKKEKDNIVDFINYPERIYPVGRLDKDSQGLILMTNDGELMNEILKARNGHEKEYEVKVDKPVTKQFLRRMAQGVPILDTGLNRQIRRMCEALGYRVKELTRLRIMNVTLGNLPEGHYRELTETEYHELERLTGRRPVWKNRKE